MSSTVAAALPLFTSSFRRMSELRGMVPLSDDTSGLNDSAIAATTAITSSSQISIRGTVTATVAQVRKNLFGPIDHEENCRFVQQEMCKISSDDRNKWNYDFKDDKPLDGRFNWEKLDASQVPVAYNMVHLQSTSSGMARALPSTNTITKTTTNGPSTSRKPRALTVKDPASSIKSRRKLSFNSVTVDSTVNTSNNINNNSSDVRISQELEDSVTNTPTTTAGEVGSNNIAVTNNNSTTSSSSSKEDIPTCIITSIQRLQDNTSSRQTSMTDFMLARKRPITATISIKGDETSAPPPAAAAAAAAAASSQEPCAKRAKQQDE